MVKRIILLVLLMLSDTWLFAQVTVTFKTDKLPPFKTAAKDLYLAGDFNNWNPADKAWQLQSGQSGNYQLIKNLPKGSYSFKVTKGSWETVECGANGKPFDNRSITIGHDTTIVLAVADWQDNYPVAEKKHTASANVHIISEKFEIPQLGRQRRIWIYLPADYAASNKKYPVIYMHDGQNLFDDFTSGYGEWGIDELMDKMPAAKQSIIVGIDHGGNYRITEYDPYDSKYGKGRGDDYVEFLVKNLKPYIDTHYRTKKDARHTTIAGSSMGGLISMYAVLKYPDVFGNGGIFSPAFWIAPDIFTYAQKQSLPGKTRFYFVCGDSEDDTMVADMKKMADIVEAKGLDKQNTPTVIIKGAKHNEKQWNGDFPAFYNWLTGGY
jgi:predicted alpha/beta superfamily hydrolase